MKKDYPSLEELRAARDWMLKHKNETLEMIEQGRIEVRGQSMSDFVESKLKGRNAGEIANTRGVKRDTVRTNVGFGGFWLAGELIRSRNRK